MHSVENFVEIRRDGKTIPESMSVDEMIAQGWSAEKVIEARWLFDGQPVSLANEHGLLAEVTPRRDGVAVLRNSGDEQVPGTLEVVNADGTSRLVIGNHQQINGRDYGGAFGWLERARVVAPNAFGAVFRAENGAMWQLDIDANTGQVLGVYETR